MTGVFGVIFLLILTIKESSGLRLSFIVMGIESLVKSLKLTLLMMT